MSSSQLPNPCPALPVESTSENSGQIVGQGMYRYQADPFWSKLPPGYIWREVAGVATDSRGRVYVYNRGDHPMMVFDRAGNFLESWGEGLVVRAHGITIGPNDMVYCTEDMGHVVRIFTAHGELLKTLGTPGAPSDTGATSMDYRSIRRAAGPFHYPTNLSFGLDGDFYVADGYGNARIHRYGPEGNLRYSWGEAGSGPGQFGIPHGIATDQAGRLYVADRENDRIQVFSPEGKFVREIGGIARPCEVCFDVSGNLYVAELGYRAGMWSGVNPPTPAATGGRIRIFDPEGQELARWGGGEDPVRAGDFFAPHDIHVDMHGDIYVSEVNWSAGANRGLVSADCHCLQKFHRLNI